VRLPSRAGLRARLMISTFAAGLLAGATLIIGFNLLLDAQLRSNADSLLRERAAASLRSLQITNGRLEVPEAPDKAAGDTRTWVFGGARSLEQPAVPGTEQLTAQRLAEHGAGFASDAHTDTRLYAVPIVGGSRRVGTLVVGASLKPYAASMRSALIASLLLGAIILAGVTVLAHWLIRRSLAPVARMTATAAEWGELDLSRRFFAGEPHDELTELAATFDSLLGRVAASLRRERHFTAEISHELRTPLARIVAEAELAIARERDSEHYRVALRAIHAAATELAGSLDALLAVARADAIQATTPIDAWAVADELVQRAARSLGPQRVKVDLDAPTPGLRVAADRDLAERALAPILDNSVRFADTRVAITIRRQAADVVFLISDDGPGVDAEIRSRIFDPGVSGGAPHGSGSGAGLGLALARRIARAAGGDVECLFNGPGPTFALRLPAA
jgi:two-component system, OmpR family, sensor kinase